MLCQPSILRDPQTKKDRMRVGCLTPVFLGPKRGRKCYITPAFSGIPKQTGTKSKVATSCQPSRGPTSGRTCYITPAFSGIPKQRGTKSKVASRYRISQNPPTPWAGPNSLLFNQHTWNGTVQHFCSVVKYRASGSRRVLRRRMRARDCPLVRLGKDKQPIQESVRVHFQGWKRIGVIPSESLDTLQAAAWIRDPNTTLAGQCAFCPPDQQSCPWPHTPSPHLPPKKLQ